MNKLGILVSQLYKQKIRSKSFILMTLLYIAIISVVMFWTEISSLFKGEDEALQIALIKETDVNLGQIFVSNEEIEFSYHTKDVKTNMYEQVKDGTLDAVIVFSDENKNLKAEIATFSPLELNDQSEISSLIQYAGKIYAIQSMNLSAQEAEQILNSEPIITSISLNEAGTEGKSEDQKQSGIWVSYLVGIVIYFFISAFLSMITTDVASEKGSRALEMLLVSVKPSTHFQSKLFGVFLLALTQFAILFGVIFALLRFTDGGTKWDMVTSLVQDLSYSYVFYVIVFLFLTIFLFLIIGALFGSLVSKVEEAGQVMMPAIMITLVGFYVMISGMANPDTLLIKIFSYIPLTSGMVMPMRIAATDLNTIEPIISLILLIVTVIAFYTLSLSFYKRSVLTYSSGGVIQKIKSVLKFTT
ncbi:ABC-2 type transport system permease protein [Lysinibacillus composti]|uniref:ABC transporter permease n=1 Tax=Lysinibacillus composti TaxID=720633 RepID=A0A3N9UA97_9BACI|nr:ABC transporter permease [Lysinibacillus composti]MBM7609924.1 ABC-2 type transport system permease protein [Lysinibacillus composti]RQW73454.1 ABC transporter permease [Lysinibacillus composti]